MLGIGRLQGKGVETFVWDKRATGNKCASGFVGDLDHLIVEISSHAIAKALTEMRQTVELGTKSASCRIRNTPLAMRRRMSPIPNAMMWDPPTPATDWAGIGQRVRKSSRS